LYSCDGSYSGSTTSNGTVVSTIGFISKLDSLMVELAEDGKETTRSDYITNEEYITPEIDEISEEASGIFIDSEGQTKNTLFLSIYSSGKYEIVRGEYDSFLDIVTVRGRIRIMEL
jgi:hypothetical protein